MLKAREKMQTELNEKAITQQDNQEKVYLFVPVCVCVCSRHDCNYCTPLI